MLDIEGTAVPKSDRVRKTRRYSQRSPAGGPRALPACNVIIGETDMSQALQAHAVRAASEALDVHESTDYKDVAFYIKNVSSSQLHAPPSLALLGDYDFAILATTCIGTLELSSNRVFKKLAVSNQLSI